MSTLLSSAPSAGSSPMPLRSASGIPSAYNPQEWAGGPRSTPGGGGGGGGGGAYVPSPNAPPPMDPSRTRNLTGMEAAMPTPPPPYSPSPSQSLSQAAGIPVPSAQGPRAVGSSSSPQVAACSEFPNRSASGGTTSHLPAVSYEYGRPTTTSPSDCTTSSAPAPQFPPPPPNGRDRSQSRTRGERSIFGLSALTRNRQSQQIEPSAIEALHLGTAEAIARAPTAHLQNHAQLRAQPGAPAEAGYDWQMEPQPRPPAARRAVSTGAISASGTAMRSREDVRSSVAWNPAMPLPPPPPGPPPNGSRSASASRTTDHVRSASSDRHGIAAPPTRRPPPQHGTALGPVPPTPADWIDEDVRTHARSPAMRGLHVDTTSVGNDDHHGGSRYGDIGTSGRRGVGEAQTAHPSSTSTLYGGLSRTPARRDPSARGIRERRSESRAARERRGEAQSAVEPSNNPWAKDMEAAATAKPPDLVLNASGGAISRRRTITRGTPRSGKSLPSPSEAPAARQPLGDRQVSDPIRSSPSLHTSDQGMPGRAFAPTPPFSPTLNEHHRSKGPSPMVPPKTLPTPPPQRMDDGGLAPSVGPASGSKDRPISHILHIPHEDVSMHAPLSPFRPPGVGRAVSPLPNTVEKAPPEESEQDAFARAAISRHNTFVEKEAAAQSDQERLELFAEYIVYESRIRRDRYSIAFDAMASDILDLTRDMWRSFVPTTGRRSTTPSGPTTAPAQGSWTPQSSTAGGSAYDAGRRSFEGASRTAQSPASSFTEPDSPASAGQTKPQRESQLWQPCLSPIPSMAMSTIPDDEDSRGRSASRWWESSAEGSSGRGGRKLERSKRESKYMGLPKEEYAQWEMDQHSAYSGTPGPSLDYSQYGPNEYPPEKVDGSGQQNGPVPTSAHSYGFLQQSAPATPDPRKLDVSRLVTLPPPYPRHHPAVENNHPELAAIRATWRQLGDLSEATNTKKSFRTKISAMGEQVRRETHERRQALRMTMQDRIRAGTASFADAAEEEAEFEAREAQRSREQVQSEFDTFEKDVMAPLHAKFSDRVSRATAAIEELRSGLCNDAQESNPNQTQEEGDEQPELLEKLTLLKWLFETREQLHREIFELTNERNDLFKAVVITPYLLAKNEDKLRETEAFFLADARERTLTFERESQQRFEQLLGTVEGAVTRGVEAQLSAFWDIAPGLRAVVQKVPTARARLRDDFAVAIPPAELAENPSYAAHPLQYLHALLTHARASARQFTESQVNLLCLLHEVKTAVMVAGSRVLASQRVGAGGEDRAAVEAEMEDVRAMEERRLTAELQERVGEAEKQWWEGLGEGIGAVTAAVEGWLKESGGWDESLLE